MSDQHDLKASFAEDWPDSRLRWTNEPARWTINRAKQCLELTTDPQTDFWRRTHYGFEFDTGHFLGCEVSRDVDWALSVQVNWNPLHQYDQAGLMVRSSPTTWIKTSVEHERDGPSRLGVVVTNHEYSDWSTQDLVPDPRAGRFRIQRVKGDYLIEFSTGGENWTQLRVAHLFEEPDAPLEAGIYACSPKAGGFTACFRELELRVANHSRR